MLELVSKIPDHLNSFIFRPTARRSIVGLIPPKPAEAGWQSVLADFVGAAGGFIRWQWLRVTFLR
jgi:hypothetical protein